MSKLLQQVKALVPNVRELIRLGQNLNRARDNFDRGEQSGPLNMERWEAYLNDPELQAAKREFFDFLNNLPYDQVVTIDSIMYIGRDEKDPHDYERRRQKFEEEEGYDFDFDEPEDGVYDSPQKKVFDYLKHIKQLNISKDVIIGMMMEKAPLPNYLTRGLRILGLQ